MASVASVKFIKKGAFGAVYLQTYDDEKYAVKVFDMSKSGGNNLDEAVAEAKTLKKLKHDHITKFFGSIRNKNEFRVFMEFCDGGDLETFIDTKRKRKELIKEDLVLKWMFETCSALEYIHELNLLHRDLKPANIFLTGEDYTSKIGDFGVSKFLDSPDATTKTFAGTPYYMSPELHKRQRYGQKTDIWSLGCCYYEIVTLKPVFSSLSFNQLVNEIVLGKIPKFPHKKYQKQIYDTILSMMQKNPANRPTCKEILSIENLFGHKLKRPTSSAENEYDVDVRKLNETLNKTINPGETNTETFHPIDPHKIKDTFDLIDPDRLEAARSVKSTIKRAEMASIDKKNYNKRDKDKGDKSFFCESRSTASSEDSTSTARSWNSQSSVKLLSQARQSLLSTGNSTCSSDSSAESLDSTLRSLVLEMERLITSTLDTDMSTVRSIMSSCDAGTLTETILSSSDAMQQAVMYELIFLWMSQTTDS